MSEAFKEGLQSLTDAMALVCVELDERIIAVAELVQEDGEREEPVRAVTVAGLDIMIRGMLSGAGSDFYLAKLELFQNFPQLFTMVQKAVEIDRAHNLLREANAAE